MQTIRWGIVGPGDIAHRFAQACKNTPGASLEAVASRSAERAEAFGDEFGVPHRFSSYETMANFYDIDAAYIATPHGAHAENAILFLNHKKAVLSEKPIALNLRQLDEMIACAEKNGVFLMEAMWARLVPGTLKALELVNSGVIGKVRGVQGSFGYSMDEDEMDHHVFDRNLGGGSVLDVGCYCLSFASWYISGAPAEIQAVADVGRTGVDEHCCYNLRYDGGEIAQLSSAIMVSKPNYGYILGTKGHIKCQRFYAPEHLEVRADGQEPLFIECPYYGNGFEEQITEASRCIREGKTQSDLIPHAQSRLIAGQMDEIRRQVGVRYPVD
ncbi:MAG: Gfo/Idh/MocA family oxidoreductase [Oscillospiraceae bacterium]|nr:Gfo/Idh/MocA family oxidoreductase [Oscillospiraceae bacterium]